MWGYAGRRTILPSIRCGTGENVSPEPEGGHFLHSAAMILPPPQGVPAKARQTSPAPEGSTEIVTGVAGTFSSQ